MCRLLGSVSREPVSLRRELVDSGHAMLRQAPSDSGWGMAVYSRADHEQPDCVRFPNAASMTGDYGTIPDARGRIHLAHVRRATFGGLSEPNTQPFCLAEYAFCHSGSI